MLTARLQQVIEQYIKRTFDILRVNLLGPDSVSAKSLIFSMRNHDPKSTLAYNYLAANLVNSSDPKNIDKSVVKQITDVASNYIDSLEKKSLSDISRTVKDNFSELDLMSKQQNKSVEMLLKEKAGQKIMANINDELQKQKDKIDASVERIVNHELHNAQNFGALDGIVGISRAIGVSDPIVFKVLVDDEYLCKTCRAIWLSNDGVTPKVYRLSELSAVSKGPKSLSPSISPQHINCRCVLTVLMPQFGFDAEGKVAYVGADHDEYKKQRGA